MKKIFNFGLSLLVVISVLSFSKPNKAVDADVYSINVQRSKIDFVAAKKSDYHTGFIPIKSGNVTIENGKLVGGSFILDMSRTQVTDGATQLNQHLLAPDFFDVAKFPEASFKINKVSYIDKSDCNIEGTLSFKGLSVSINLKATIQSAEGKDGFFAHAYYSLDRTLLGINYGAGHIDNRVQLAIYLFAKK